MRARAEKFTGLTSNGSDGTRTDFSSRRTQEMGQRKTAPHVRWSQHSFQLPLEIFYVSRRSGLRTYFWKIDGGDDGARTRDLRRDRPAF